MRPLQAKHLSRGSAVTADTRPKESSSKASWYLIVVYLLLEFGRPQDLLGLSVFYLPTLINAAIGILLFTTMKVTFSNKQTKLYLGLLGLMIIHGPIATNNFQAYMSFKTMALSFVFYLGLVTFADSVSNVQTLATVWLGVHLWLAVIGILKGGSGIGGWIGDENDFCMQLNMVLPFAFFGLFSATSKLKKLACQGLLPVYLFAIMTTLSRGGFIGMAAVGVYCWLRSPRKILSMGLVLLLIGFMLIAAPKKYWAEIESSGSDETMGVGTGGERLYTWGIAFEMFLANPIIGVGQGNLPWVFKEYEGGRTFNQKSIAGREAHSMYFTLLPELGLVGSGLFVGLVYFTWKDLRSIFKAYRNRAGLKPEQAEELRQAYFLALAMEGSLIGNLVSSIFISTLYYPSFWVMMGFAVALKNAVTRSSVLPAETSPQRFDFRKSQANQLPS
jgi:hypothetical protein